jgi:hypothetical protein
LQRRSFGLISLLAIPNASRKSIIDAMATGRPVAFDITHLLSRLDISAPTGIDRVDLSYAKHFIASGKGSAVWFWLGYPATLPSKEFEALVDSPQYTDDDIEND